jgi:hypothetical protein
MSRLARLSACSTLALSIASGPAFAELSAQQVWDGMEDAMQGFGYSVTATETLGAGGVTVSDVVLNIAMPEDNGSVSVSISEIVLTENGDGSVTMTFPASMPISIDAAPEGEDTVKMTFDYASTGLEMVVSGEESDMLYSYGADQLVLRLAELLVNGTPVPAEEARFSFTMDGVSGTSAIATSTGTQIRQGLTTDAARYDIAFNDPESDDTALISGSMDQVSVESSTTLPEGFDPANLDSLAAGGFAADATLGYSNGQMQFAVNEPAGATSGTTSTGSVALAFSVDGTAMRYDLSATDQAVSISGPELPIPVNVSMAEMGFKLQAPLAKADAPQDMAFGLTLGGFQMSELLWNMVDPGAALPRDPATIALNLTGQVTPFVNFFDPAAVAQLEATGGLPGELNALTLSNLTIEAAGAKLAGTGSFTFDNADLQTFGGFPRPNGGVELTLEGANALIDKLIAMGLMTSEDAMGARMMMSMFAVPGDGPDNLKSTIQINEEGHVLANGMRIQ